MRHSLIILAIISIFAAIVTCQRLVEATSPPPISDTQLQVTLEGILHQGPTLAIPGTNLPASAYILSVNGFGFALDFSSAPQLASVAESNINNKVTVSGKLVRKTTETPAGLEIEWFVLEVFGISVV